MPHINRWKWKTSAHNTQPVDVPTWDHHTQVVGPPDGHIYVGMLEQSLLKGCGSVWVSLDSEQAS